jgi:hypothetical protein
MPAANAATPAEVFWSMLFAISLTFTFLGWMRIVLEGFRHNLLEGVLCQFVPFYNLYFAFIKCEKVGSGDDVWLLRLLWLAHLPLGVAIVVILAVPYPNATEMGMVLLLPLVAVMFIVFVVGIIMSAMSSKTEEAKA